MKITIQNIENLLNDLKESNEELNDIFIHRERCGRRIALARRSDNSFMISSKNSGFTILLTDYLTLQEMNQFLRGYLFKSSNKFN